MFQEPIRDAWLFDAFRRLWPRTGDDVSPYEAPLKTSAFRAVLERHGISIVAERAFRTPVVKLLRPLGLEQLAYRLDRLLLKVPGMEHFATVKVVVGRKR